MNEVPTHEGHMVHCLQHLDVVHDVTHAMSKGQIIILTCHMSTSLKRRSSKAFLINLWALTSDKVNQDS